MGRMLAGRSSEKKQTEHMEVIHIVQEGSALLSTMLNGSKTKVAWSITI